MLGWTVPWEGSLEGSGKSGGLEVFERERSGKGQGRAGLSGRGRVYWKFGGAQSCWLIWAVRQFGGAPGIWLTFRPFQVSKVWCTGGFFLVRGLCGNCAFCWVLQNPGTPETGPNRAPTVNSSSSVSTHLLPPTMPRATANVIRPESTHSTPRYLPRYAGSSSYIMKFL